MAEMNYKSLCEPVQAPFDDDFTKRKSNKSNGTPSKKNLKVNSGVFRPSFVPKVWISKVWKNKNLGYKKFNRNRLGTITTITHTYLRYLRYLSPYKRFPEEVLLIMIHINPLL